MIREMQERLSLHVPLRIEFAGDVGNDVLSVTGVGWALSVDGAWRVTRGGVLIFGHSSEPIAPRLTELIGLDVVGVRPQSISAPFDPAFELSDGSSIEVFSDHVVDPWVFAIPEFTFVGSPGDISELDN